MKASEDVFEDAEIEERARQAERRLGGTLGSLRERGENMIGDLRSARLPVRMAGAALVAGTAAVLLISAVRAMARRRYARRRYAVRWGGSVAGTAGRSFVKEMGARILLGAAGVVGARFAGEVLMPLIAGQIADGLERASAAERDPSEEETRATEEETQATTKQTRARQGRRARVTSE